MYGYCIKIGLLNALEIQLPKRYVKLSIFHKVATEELPNRCFIMYFNILSLKSPMLLNFFVFLLKSQLLPMKKHILSIVLALCITGLKSQVFYMCGGTYSTTSSSGTIYDSGGPNGNYSNYEYCTFLIKANCPGNITLNFSFFDTELNYDYLRVYNGNTTSAPLLGGYWGTGNVPTMVATSGYMLLEFYSDGVTTQGGFAASWTSSGCGPIANFSTTVNSCQGKVFFTDVSQNSPTSWLWNFGDGGGSALQNPVYTYTAPGTYPVTLVASNSAGSNSTTKNVTVNPIIFNIGYNGAPLMNSPISFTTDYATGQVYTWVFGDGSFGGTQNAIHTYTSMGNYNVTLNVATGSCVATSSMQVLVNNGVGIEQYASASYHARINPNPFVGSSTLNLQLLKDESVSIDVINQLGQLQQVIYTGKLQAGDHAYSIDKLPAGIYYLRIKEGDTTRTLKMVSAN
jgi:PKD repeat protein